MAPYMALTLWPEWAWVIAAGASWPAVLVPKRVENRVWRPSDGALPVGSRIAIHAGAHMGGRPGQAALVEGKRAVMGMYATANGSLPWMGFDRDLVACPRSAIVCTATIDGYDRDQRTGWDVPGAWHWRLRDVVALARPVPCRGAQGLWMLPEDVAKEVSRG